MFKTITRELKVMAFTPSMGVRRKVWREAIAPGQDPPPAVVEAWKRNFKRDMVDCRALISQGWDGFAIGNAFARLFTEQGKGRLDMSLLEAALDVVESPNPLHEMLKPPKR